MSFEKEFEIIENHTAYIPLNDPVLRFQGKDLTKFLQGVLSNDIHLLQKQTMIPACFLSAKGKWIAALQLFQVNDSIFVKTSSLEAQNLLQAIQPLILFSESRLEDLSQNYQWILVIGKSAPLKVKNINLPCFELKDFRLPAFLVLCPRENLEPFSTNHPFIEKPAEILNILQIESKIPVFGKDVDEKTIPLEAGLDNYFSYTKGCYVGQETISRIKHYGKVNKQLVKLKFLSSSLPLEKGAQEGFSDKIVALYKDLYCKIPLNPPSSKGENASVGKITRACYSPFYKSFIALAIIHSEAGVPGTSLMIQSPQEQIAAEVME